MEHRLITGGFEYLPFARSCITKLKRLGLPYADQSFEIDGVSIKVRIEPGHEYIRIEGGGDERYLAWPRDKDHSQGDVILPTGFMGSAICELLLDQKLQVTRHSKKLAGLHDWKQKISYNHGWSTRYAMGQAHIYVFSGTSGYRDIPGFKTGTEQGGGSPSPPASTDFFASLYGSPEPAVYIDGLFIYAAKRATDGALDAQYFVIGAAITKGDDGNKYVVIISPYVEDATVTPANVESLSNPLYCRAVHVYACSLGNAMSKGTMDLSVPPIPPIWTKIGEFKLTTEHARLHADGTSYLYPHVEMPWFFDGEGSTAVTVMAKYGALRFGGTSKLYAKVRIVGVKDDGVEIDGTTEFSVADVSREIFAVDFKGTSEVELYYETVFTGAAYRSDFTTRIIAGEKVLYERENRYEFTYPTEVYDIERISVIGMDARTGVIAYEALHSVGSSETKSELSAYIVLQIGGKEVVKKRFIHIDPYPSLPIHASGGVFRGAMAIPRPVGSGTSTYILWRADYIATKWVGGGNFKSRKANNYVCSIDSEKSITDFLLTMAGLDIPVSFQAINRVVRDGKEYPIAELTAQIPYYPATEEVAKNKEFIMSPIKV